MPFRRAPNCATGPLWVWKCRTTHPSTRVGTPQPLHKLHKKTDTQAVRSKLSGSGSIGRRGNRLGHLAAMCERQPVRQPAGRFLRRLAVEGHHRRGHPRLPVKLGPPPVTDGHHFDLVRMPADSFFEMVNDHLSGGPTARSEVPVILRRRHVRSSEDDHEGASTMPPVWGSSDDPTEEKCALSGCPQDLHASSTVFPQSGGYRRRNAAPGHSKGRMRGYC